MTVKGRRKNPDMAPKQSLHEMQVDFLVGLRIMEHLGKRCPSPHDMVHERDDELIKILNWFTLCIVSDSSLPYYDVACTLSAVPGLVTIYFTKGSAHPPNKKDHESVTLFLSTLRRVLADELDSTSALQSFLSMLAVKIFPEFYRKLTLIGATESNDPSRTFNRFHGLVDTWRKCRPQGEESSGFVDIAKNIRGGAEHATELLVECVLNLMCPEPIKHPGDADAKNAYMLPVLEACTLVTASTFFHELVQSDSAFRGSLEVNDVLFLHDLLERISAVARYRSGCLAFVGRGIHFLKDVLGTQGIADFINGEGSIVVRWISRGHSRPYKLYHWPTSPRVEIKQLLELETLAIDDLDDELREYIAQTEPVTDMWSKGGAVTPVLHCELQMILYLEKYGISVVGNSIGMNQPPCWACHCYMKKHNSTPDSVQWKMSHTTGRPRGYWRVPPGHPDIAVLVLRALDKKVEHVVEEYAYECYP